MSVTHGAEFNIAAALHDPEVKRKLANRTTSGVDDSVTSGFTKPEAGRVGQGTRADRFFDMLQFVQNNDYFEQQQKLIIAKMDRYDQALIIAETELLQQCEDPMRNAYQLDDGTKVFFSEDVRQ